MQTSKLIIFPPQIHAVEGTDPGSETKNGDVFNLFLKFKIHRARYRLELFVKGPS